MDKQQFSNKKKKYKRKKRKLSSTSMNFDLESIREDNLELEQHQHNSMQREAQVLRSEDSFARLGIPDTHQSESEIQFPVEEEDEKNISVVEREDLQRVIPSSNLRNILAKGNILPPLEEDSSSKHSNNPELSLSGDVPKRILPNDDASSKFVKIYEPDKFFQEKPDNKMLLLYPFLLSKHYVDSVRRSNIFTKPNMPNIASDSSQGGFPAFKSQVDSTPKNTERVSESQTDLMSESQKCKKISKKLRRAWNLNQQIAQNVFKKVTLLYNSREDSLSSKSKEQTHSVFKNPEKMYLGKYGFGEENRGDQMNVNEKESESSIGLRSRQRRKNFLKKVKTKQDDQMENPGRTLRKTTRIKKKIENERLKRQEKNKQRRSKNFGWNIDNSITQMRFGLNKLVKPNLLTDRRKFEKVEFLDYANKNIRKKKKEQKPDNDEEDF